MRLSFLNDVSHFVCDGFHNIGTHQITAIGKTGISLDQLHGRDLYFITNGHPGLGNTAPFIRALEPSTFRSEEHTSELQSRGQLVCRLLLERTKNARNTRPDERCDY